jgi:type IV secretory pathway TraG/TraD family ATPase VirD4
MNAMQTKCILPAYSDVEVLKEFTALNGDQELNIQQDKRSYKTKKNVSTPDEIRRLKKDEVLIISQNLKPIITKQLRYFDDDEMILNQYLGGLK